MKIATWNVERLKCKNRISQIIDECNKVSADIFVLTETDRQLKLDYKYAYETSALNESCGISYKHTENRVTIFTNYPCVRLHPTYDLKTAICVELATENGNILVYGTIIGIFGNRHPTFTPDLKMQMDDVKRLANLADGFCICGDFNCSFADNYYFTKDARRTILDTFEENNIRLMTKTQPKCIDHIAVSNYIVGNGCITVKEWNIDKTLSDHKGVSVTFDAAN